MEQQAALGPQALSEEQQAAIERLRSSCTFARAPRLKLLLDFILDTWLAGHAEDLTEQIIGLKVFGRSSDDVGGENNLVRVSVRNLRARLEEYYTTEGSAERWLVKIPKGRYVPSLVVRGTTSPASSLREPEVAEAAPANAHIASGALRRAVKSRWSWAAVFLAAGLIGALLGRAGGDRHRAMRNSLIYQLLIPSHADVNLVVVDSSLQYYRELLNRNPLLSEYAEGTLGRREPDFPPQLQLYFPHARDTSLSSLFTVMQLSTALPGRQVRIRHPRDISVRDFQHGHWVLLGGPWINPWGQMFEDRFALRMVPTVRAASSSVQNLKPGPGERTNYAPYRDGVKEVAYARVGLTGNLQGTGRVLLLGATSGSALESAARYLSSSGSAAELNSRLRRNAVDLDALEFLLEIESYQGTPRGSRLVLARVPDSPR